jgi:hypothetical protein
MQRTQSETKALATKKAKAKAKAEREATDNLDPESDDSDDDDDDDDAHSSDGEGSDSDSGGVQLDKLPEEQEAEDAAAAATAPVMDPFLRGDIPRAVFNAARKETTNNVTFALELVEVFRSFPRTRGLRDDAYAGLGDGPVAVAARCKRGIEDVGPDESLDSVDERAAAFAECVEAFRTALASTDLATAGLWEEYVVFLQSKGAVVPEQPLLDAVVVEVCTAAHAAGLASAAVYSTWIDTVLADSSQKQRVYANALAVAEMATTAVEQEEQEEQDDEEEEDGDDAMDAEGGGKGGASSALSPVASDVNLWLRRGALAALVQPGEPGAPFVDAVFAAALGAVPAADRDAVAHAQVGYCLAHRNPTAVHAAFVQKIAIQDQLAWSSEKDAGRTNPRVEYAEWVCSTSGIAAARELYITLIKASPVQMSWVSFQRFIAVELRQPAPEMESVRQLYERAAAVYGKHVPEVWLEYALAEVGAGEPKNASTIYWRAVKLLNDPEPFISQYRLHQLGLAA